MKNGLIICLALILSRFGSLAQLPRALQIAVTNGSVTVFSQNAPGYFFGQLETTTNLSPPVVWNSTRSPYAEYGESDSFAVSGSARFFRLRQYYPIFQFAIFYNVNMEIAPGAAMTITGPVFCNQNIWEGSGNATFSSTVTAVGTNSSMQNDPFALNYGPQTPPAVFSLAGQPVSGNAPLYLPIGANINPANARKILNLPPPAYAMGTTAAYSTNGQVYLANAADLVITNFANGTNDGPLTPTGTNMFIYFQDSSLVSSLLQLPFDFYILTNRGAGTVKTTNYVAAVFATNVIFAGYSFVTNVAFYDWREGWNGGSGPPKRVEVVQLDVAKLEIWMTNAISVNGTAVGGYSYDQTRLSHGHHIGGVYVYTSVPLTTSQLPAVRVVNGQLLPNPDNASSPYGLTVATPLPMYVLGNYNVQTNGGVPKVGLANNTASTYPAALMADSITILSTNWSDSDTNLLPTGSTHGPGSTTVNAAILEGIVASDPTINGDYSGGVENFVRLLEDWSSGVPIGKQILTYNGSIVVLFYSQYATNHWQQTGNYYNPPMRNWAFDMNFTNAAKLPPLTPNVVNLVTP